MSTYQSRNENTQSKIGAGVDRQTCFICRFIYVVALKSNKLFTFCGFSRILTYLKMNLVRYEIPDSYDEPLLPDSAKPTMRSISSTYSIEIPHNNSYTFENTPRNQPFPGTSNNRIKITHKGGSARVPAQSTWGSVSIMPLEKSTKRRTRNFYLDLPDYREVQSPLQTRPTGPIPLERINGEDPGTLHQVHGMVQLIPGDTSSTERSRKLKERHILRSAHVIPDYIQRGRGRKMTHFIYQYVDGQQYNSLSRRDWSSHTYDKAETVCNRWKAAEMTEEQEGVRMARGRDEEDESVEEYSEEHSEQNNENELQPSIEGEYESDEEQDSIDDEGNRSE
ncbi:hypothetical protein HYALB_00001733 [Hymenoscyphus albidus]|uniref:Uncharacterized protein n=1 Tax=Hymenoscyphus albidus TaxID=595503 RepID=A0A9N9PY20_9HELO|nr:hypothetical protein HYALB_00001733 [Hymenoscyphus albidus]